MGYDGPQGTVGRRLQLRFRLMALDTVLEAEAGADADEILAAAEEAIIDEAELPVVWERARPREAGR